MESLRNTAAVPSERGRMSVISGPLLSDGTDSVLTAARLARRGWTQEGKKTGWQLSHANNSSRQPSVSRSDGNQLQILLEVSLKDPRRRQAPVSHSRTTSEDRDTCSEKKKEEEKQRSAFLPNRQNNRNALTDKYKILCGQAGVVYVWVSGCRTKSRPSKRFKAPMLPVIAEICADGY